MEKHRERQNPKEETALCSKAWTMDSEREREVEGGREKERENPKGTALK